MLVQADLSSLHKSAPRGSFSPAACWALASPTSSHRILAAVPSRHVLLQLPFSGAEIETPQCYVTYIQLINMYGAPHASDAVLGTWDTVGTKQTQETCPATVEPEALGGTGWKVCGTPGHKLPRLY